MPEVFTRRISIYVESGQAQAAYDALVAKQQVLTAKIQEYTNKGKEIPAKLTKQLEGVNAAMDRQSKKISGELAPSLKDLRGSYEKLSRELNLMSKQDPGFSKKKAETIAAKNALDSYKVSLASVRQNFAQMMQQAKGVAFGVLIGNSIESGVTAALGFMKSLYDGAIKISDEFSDIEKTTGLTSENVAKLNSELSKIDTRTSNSKLRQFAVDAGKLGKEGVEDIKEFVRQADQINVALGQDLGEGAITDIGKIADIFHLSMLQIASGINEVGQNSSASEAWQKDFMFRTAGMAKTVGLLAGEILGYGAALDINGMQVEASSTALQNTLIDFTKNTEKFGRAAGMTRGELTKIAQEQGVNKAFLAFLKNLKESSKSSDELLKRLEELGIDGSRGAATFLTLAENIGLVEQQQKLANEAIAEGISVTQEFEKRNHNFAAATERLAKAWASFTTSGSLQGFMGATVDGLTKLIKLLDGAVSGYFRIWGAVGNAAQSVKTFYKELSEQNVVLRTFNSAFDRMVIQPFEILSGAAKNLLKDLGLVNEEIDKTAKKGPLTIGGEEIDTPRSGSVKSKSIIGMGSDAPSGGSGSPAKARVSAEKEANDYIKKLRHELLLDQLSEDAREIQLVRDKYAEKRAILKAEAAKTGQDISIELDLLNRSEALAIAEVTEKYAQKYDEMAISAEESFKRVEAAAAFSSNPDFQTRLKKGLEGIKDEFQTVMEVLQSAATFMSTIFQIMDQEEQQALAKDEKYNKEKLENLQERLQNGRISQKAYNREVERIEKEAEKKRKEVVEKQFKRNKAIQITMAAINTASAVMNALSTSGNIYAGIALAAFAAATGAAQIALIAKSEPPEYETGTEGWRAGIGGDKHSDSSRGNPILDGSTGKVLGRVEQGEAFIPADSTAANQGAIRWMIANRGKPLPRFSNSLSEYAGGTAWWMNQKGAPQLPAQVFDDYRSTGTGGVPWWKGQKGAPQLPAHVFDEIMKRVSRPAKVVFVKEEYDRFNERVDYINTRTSFDNQPAS